MISTWKSLQAELPSAVLHTLVTKGFWSRETGPSERLEGLTQQLSRYFGYYPDSETLRAEFMPEFSGLDQQERDTLFRLVKSLGLGRASLHVS